MRIFTLFCLKRIKFLSAYIQITIVKVDESEIWRQEIFV